MNFHLGCDSLDVPLSTGTTIIAAEFDEGVIIGADSRTSSGPYVGNRVSDKLTPITEKIYCCRSGSAADTQALADIVAYSTYFFENQNVRDAYVSEVAAEFRRFIYNNRDTISAEITVAGFDDVHGGQVYAISGGMLIRQSCAIGGSGSKYLFGFVRENYKENMKMENSVNFVKKAVFHGMFHDNSSGGVCRIGIIAKEGIERRVFLADQ